jgi:hypothetical protein
MRSSAGVEANVPAKTILFLASDGSIQNCREIYWYNHKPKRCSHLAARPDLAHELWQVSSKLCKLDESQTGEL